MARKRPYDYFQNTVNAAKMAMATPAKIMKAGNMIDNTGKLITNTFQNQPMQTLGSNLSKVGSTINQYGNQGQQALNGMKQGLVDKVTSGFGGSKPIDMSILQQQGINGATNTAGNMSLNTAMTNPSAVTSMSSLGGTAPVTASLADATVTGIGGTAGGLGAGVGTGALATGLGEGVADTAIGSAIDSAVMGGGEALVDGAFGTAADAAISGGTSGVAAGAGAGGLAGMGAVATGGIVAAPLIGLAIGKMLMDQKKAQQEQAMQLSQGVRDETGEMREKQNAIAQNQMKQMQQMNNANVANMVKQNTANRMAQQGYEGKLPAIGGMNPQQQFASVQPSAIEKLRQDYATGAAASVPSVLDTQSQAQALAQQETDTQSAAPVHPQQSQQPLTGNTVAQQDNRGMVEKLLGGISDFMAGYEENANTSFSPENLKPQAYYDSNIGPQINPEDYMTKLDQFDQGKFDAWAKANNIPLSNDYDMQGYWKEKVQPYDVLRAGGYSEDQIRGVQQGLNGGDKRLAEFIEQNKIRSPQTEDEILAAKNNRFNAKGYDPSTKHFTDEYKLPNHKTFSTESKYATGDMAKYAGTWDKDGNFVKPNIRSNDKMSKLGELVGTTQRIAGNPLVQGLLAYAMTKNAAPRLGNYGALLNGYKVMNERANTVGNQAVLRSMGYDVPDIGPFTKISDKAVNTIPMNYYRMGNLNNNIYKADNQKAHYERQDKNTANRNQTYATEVGNRGEYYRTKGKADIMNARTNAYKASSTDKHYQRADANTRQKINYDYTLGKERNANAPRGQIIDQKNLSDIQKNEAIMAEKQGFGSVDEMHDYNDFIKLKRANKLTAQDVLLFKQTYGYDPTRR